MRNVFSFTLIFLLCCMTQTLSAQFCAVRVNALAPLTGTVDVGLDVAVSDKWTLDINGALNPINTKRFSTNFYATQLGAKYWLYENYMGHFIGQQLSYVNYDIGDRSRRYNGNAIGVGLSYGYSWILSTRWCLSVEAGLGLYFTKDKGRDTEVDDWTTEYIRHTRRLTLAPSRLGVTFSYLF